jgi:hypothetical protein
VTREQRDHIIEQLGDDAKCEYAMRQVQRRLNPVGWDQGLSAWDWADVAAWFSENWEEILRILLIVLPLLLGDDDAS